VAQSAVSYGELFLSFVSHSTTAHLQSNSLALVKYWSLASLYWHISSYLQPIIVFMTTFDYLYIIDHIRVKWPVAKPCCIWHSAILFISASSYLSISRFKFYRVYYDGDKFCFAFLATLSSLLLSYSYNLVNIGFVDLFTF
jgi:hypothetical protein